jgi:hypothetical protein
LAIQFKQVVRRELQKKEGKIWSKERKSKEIFMLKREKDKNKPQSFGPPTTFCYSLKDLLGV